MGATALPYRVHIFAGGAPRTGAGFCPCPACVAHPFKGLVVPGPNPRAYCAPLQPAEVTHSGRRRNRGQFSEGGQMKILGLLVCVLGWFIAALSVKVPGVYAQLLVALAGFVVALIGALGILNGAHLKNAIWKA